jgi:hypothetical protein
MKPPAQLIYPNRNVFKRFKRPIKPQARWIGEVLFYRVNTWRPKEIFFFSNT